MPKRAYFVIGSEGSGTNMLAEALVSAGCHYEPRHNSHLEDYEFDKMPSPFVFRRSMPHAGKWPDIDGLVDQMTRAHYDVFPVTIVRDLTITYFSVLRRDSNRSPLEVLMNTRKSLSAIADIGGDRIARRGPTFVSYEAFCLDPQYRRWLFNRLGLPEPTIEIHYANPKYYEGGEDYLK